MISIRVSQDQVGQAYQELAHYFERDRLENHRATQEDEYHLVLSGDAQLWISIDDGAVTGAAITRIFDYPQAPTLVILTMAGDGSDWNTLIQDLELFAANAGCTHLEIMGRRGWLRRLSGFEESFTTICKRLTHVS